MVFVVASFLGLSPTTFAESYMGSLLEDLAEVSCFSLCVCVCVCVCDIASWEIVVALICEIGSYRIHHFSGIGIANLLLL